MEYNWFLFTKINSQTYLSAQIPTVKEQFSTLHPVIIDPSAHNTAAPTLNLL